MKLCVKCESSVSAVWFQLMKHVPHFCCAELKRASWSGCWRACSVYPDDSLLLHRRRPSSPLVVQQLSKSQLTSEQKKKPSHTNQGRGCAVPTKKKTGMFCINMHATVSLCNPAAHIWICDSYFPSHLLVSIVLFWFGLFYDSTIQPELQLHQGLAFSFVFSGLDFVLFSSINLWEKKELNQ